MRKKILYFAFAILAITACNKDNSTPEPKEGGLSCTMIIYGSAGADTNNTVELDSINELIDAMKAGPTEKVNVISQYNFDCEDPSLKYLGGTVIMRLLKKNEEIGYIDYELLDYSQCKTLPDSNQVRSKAMNAKIGEMVESGAYSFAQVNGTEKVKLYLPSEIARFLDRAAKECPADHYHFCITGHGGGWDPCDDRDVTKAVAYDNTAPDTLGISAKNLTAGINASSIAGKIPVLYLNACEMNFLENICEYASCPVQYAMLSFRYTNGTDNETVMEELMSTKGNGVSDLLEALQSAYEEVYKGKSCDISFVDLKKMKSAAAGVKDLVPLLKDDYKDDPDWYNQEIRALTCPTDERISCDKDFSEFLADLSVEENLDPAIKTTAASILADIQASIVKTIYGGKCPLKENLLTGVKFIGKNDYAAWRANYGESFDNNAFYALTNWNTLFEIFDDKINKQQ